MPIQILLTLVLGAALVYASVQKLMPRPVTGTFALLVAVGVYFVWMPTHTTVVAQWLGVGRGTDLLIYLWIVLTLIVGLNLHLKIQSIRAEITELARAMALATVLEPEEPEAPAGEPRDREAQG